MRLIGSRYDKNLNLTSVTVEADGKEYRFEIVRHGRWVVDDLGRTHCSKCGERLPFFRCYSDEPNSDYDEEWDEEIPETRYCPNCGAKMRCDNADCDAAE